MTRRAHPSWNPFLLPVTAFAIEFQRINHYKNRLVVLPTEYLSCIVACRKAEETVVMRGSLLVLETNCLRQPERQLPSSSTTTIH